ncbi:hypothetical protein Actkin_02312 [Actinokineospora sp. UTMC 2448]|nr:hypothetical protein Actkin_02312 [Actinokineospora sp. UTMC 2448]
MATDQGVQTLPAAYVEFLRRMGRNGGSFLVGPLVSSSAAAEPAFSAGADAMIRPTRARR